MSTNSLSDSQFHHFAYGYLSRVDLANHRRRRRRWCDYALLVLFVAVLQHIVVNGSLFVIITVLSYCLQSCSSDLYILSLAWFDTSLYSGRVQSIQSNYCLWRFEVFAEVRVVKAVPSCGDHFLHRRCSRVARFDNIFYFGFWMLLYLKSSA